MKTNFRLFIVLLVAVSLNSCIGYNPKEIFTPFNANYKADCAVPPADVELVFEGELPNFKYEKVGLIEIQAEYIGKEVDQLNSLKKLAKSKCCNAVIGVKKGYVTRDMGLVFTNDKNETYQAVSFSGIAVKKNKN